MKNASLRSLGGILLIAFTFSGCEIFDTADDVTFDVELTHTFAIDENLDSQGQPVTYSSTDAWDPNDNAEFAKYKDKIKEITVNSVTYTVTDFAAEGDVIFSNGTGKFKATANSATALASAGISIQSIQGAQGSTHELAYTIADLSVIADQLEKIEPVYFEVGGTFSHTPVAFNVPVKIHCTITADALE